MISIHREFENENGCFGKFYKDGMLIAYTLEPQWNDNKSNASCIPKGSYKVKKRWSPKYKNHWILQDVPDRKYILIHNGNWLRHTKGCILVGDRYLTEGDIVNGVGNSVNTMEKLRVILPDEFNLAIL